jgi:hypothetical protein
VLGCFLQVYLKATIMNRETFDNLSEPEKNALIFDANKIDDLSDEFFHYQLFKIDNFYIEVITAVDQYARKQVNTYLVKNIPLLYAAKVYNSM